jgi:hypothetical protein
VKCGPDIPARADSVALSRRPFSLPRRKVGLTLGEFCRSTGAEHFCVVGVNKPIATSICRVADRLICD